MPQNNALLVYKGGWEELENAVFADDSGALNSITTSSGLYITPDGRFVFVADLNQQTVNKYSLSIPWDASSIGAFVDKFDVSADITAPTNIDFKGDGTIMFVTGEFPSPGVFRYVLPIPFDITSIVSAPTSFVPGVASIHTVIFTPDGFNFFLTTSDVTKYSTDTAFDFDNVTQVQIFTPSVNPTVVAFKPQGDKMYVGGGTANIIEFDLSAPFDISAPVDTGNFLDPVQTNVEGYVFRPNGKEFFTMSQGLDVVFKHIVDEEWNISTASIFANSKLDGNTPNAINWKHDGTKMIVLDDADTSVKDFSTPNPWNLSTTTQDSAFDVSVAISSANGMDWRPNGTRCYVINNIGTLAQFNVSTPWTVSTMSDSGISHQFTGVNIATDVFFRQDGKKVYVCNAFSGLTSEVHEHDLSIAWDITTIGAAVTTLDVLADSPNVTGVTFKLDGKIMYLSNGGGGGLITRYTLSVPWDISTAVFVDSFDASAQDSDVQGLFIRQHDGKKLFIAGNTTNSLYCFSMSPEFNNAIITSLGEEIVDDTGAIIVHTS